MINAKLIKTIGFAATVIGFGSSLVAQWVSDKKIEETITEKVNKALIKAGE